MDGPDDRGVRPRSYVRKRCRVREIQVASWEVEDEITDRLEKAATELKQFKEMQKFMKQMRGMVPR